jgi:hypothetical protein
VREGLSNNSCRYYASSSAEYNGNCNASASHAFDDAAAAAAAAGSQQKQNYGAGAQQKQKYGQQQPQAPEREPAHMLGGASSNLIADIAPLLQKFGVDLFVAGHWHYYESLWRVIPPFHPKIARFPPFYPMFARFPPDVLLGNAARSSYRTLVWSFA